MKRVIAVCLLLMLLFGTMFGCSWFWYQRGRQVPNYDDFNIWVVQNDTGSYVYIENIYGGVYIQQIDLSMSIFEYGSEEDDASVAE